MAPLPPHHSPAFTGHPAPPLAVVLPTHTTRHLRRTLLGVACQIRRPARVAVSCDNLATEVRDCVQHAAADFGLEILLVQRAFAGRSRSGQVRNNAVRALIQSGLDPAARLVFFDGDCCPAPNALATHEQLATDPARDVVIGFRVDLTPEQTEAFSDSALREHRLPVEVLPAQARALARREARYRRQVAMRRLHLAKSHKPKLLSANFSVSLDSYLAVNGFDEAYEGYGQEDDDFGRRLYAAGCRPVLGITRVLTFHLYHPTRAPGDWHESPNAARFLGGGPIRCELGVDNPAPQDEPITTLCAPRPAAAAAT